MQDVCWKTYSPRSMSILKFLAKILTFCARFVLVLTLVAEIQLSVSESCVQFSNKQFFFCALCFSLIIIEAVAILSYDLRNFPLLRFWWCQHNVLVLSL